MIKQAGSGATSFRVGDRVRTEVGLKGKITILNNDGVTAYVQLDENAIGTHVALYRLDTLTKIVGEVD
jgi:preprotein translocase subunit YajC